MIYFIYRKIFPFSNFRQQRQRIQQNVQQNNQNVQQNPFQNIDLLKTSTKDIISFLKGNQFLLSSFPPEFQKAILDNNEKIVEKALEPLKEKLKHQGNFNKFNLKN